MSDFIKKQLASNVSEAEINSQLQSQGWNQVDINEALESARTNVSPPNSQPVNPSAAKSPSYLLPLTGFFIAISSFILWLFLGFFPKLTIVGMILGIVGFILGVVTLIKTTHVKIGISSLIISFLGFVFMLFFFLYATFIRPNYTYEGFKDVTITTEKADDYKPIPTSSIGNKKEEIVNPTSKPRVKPQGVVFDVPSLLGKSQEELRSMFGEPYMVGTGNGYVSFDKNPLVFTSFYDLDDTTKYRYSSISVSQSEGEIVSKEDIFTALNLVEGSKDYIIRINYRNGDTTQFILSVDVYPPDSTDFSLN